MADMTTEEALADAERRASGWMDKATKRAEAGKQLAAATKHIMEVLSLSSLELACKYGDTVDAAAVIEDAADKVRAALARWQELEGNRG